MQWKVSDEVAVVHVIRPLARLPPSFRIPLDLTDSANGMLRHLVFLHHLTWWVFWQSEIRHPNPAGRINLLSPLEPSLTCQWTRMALKELEQPLIGSPKCELKSWDERSELHGLSPASVLNVIQMRSLTSSHSCPLPGLSIATPGDGLTLLSPGGQQEHPWAALLIIDT